MRPVSAAGSRDAAALNVVTIASAGDHAPARVRTSSSFRFRLVVALAGSSLVTALLAAAARLDPSRSAFAPNTPERRDREWRGGGDHRSGAVNPSPVARMERHAARLVQRDLDGCGPPFARRYLSLRRDCRWAGEHPHRRRAGRPPVHLTRGAHSVLIHYTHEQRGAAVEFLWARGDEALTPVPAWALRPHKVRSAPRLIAEAALDRALAASEWVWVGLLVLARGDAGALRGSPSSCNRAR